MATAAAAKAASAALTVGQTRPFQLGKKKLYLPNHLVTFLRPKPGQSATTATFEVPLTFNKFDLRDYLYHLYNVEVTSVRSFINQRMPAQRQVGQSSKGQWYRPRAQKLMMVDLVKPFTWPARPGASEMDEWDHTLFAAVAQGHERQTDATVAAQSWGPQPLRTEEAAPRERRELQRQAAALLAGRKRWTPGREPLAAVRRPQEAVLDGGP